MTQFNRALKGVTLDQDFQYFIENLFRILVKTTLIALVSIFLVLSTSARSEENISTNILVLDFELNDLTLHPHTAKEEKRVATLRPLLEQAFSEEFNHTIANLSQTLRDKENKGKGYVFDRPEVAANMARSASADWVVSGRLHKASFLFVYLRAQLIDAKSGKLRSDFVVEIKGWEPHLTAKGIDTLALQIDESLQTLLSN